MTGEDAWAGSSPKFFMSESGSAYHLALVHYYHFIPTVQVGGIIPTLQLRKPVEAQRDQQSEKGWGPHPQKGIWKQRRRAQVRRRQTASLQVPTSQTRTKLTFPPKHVCLLAPATTPGQKSFLKFPA